MDLYILEDHAASIIYKEYTNINSSGFCWMCNWIHYTIKSDKVKPFSLTADNNNSGKSSIEKIKNITLKSSYNMQIS